VPFLSVRIVRETRGREMAMKQVDRRREHMWEEQGRCSRCCPSCLVRICVLRLRGGNDSCRRCLYLTASSAVPCTGVMMGMYAGTVYEDAAFSS